MQVHKVLGNGFQEVKCQREIDLILQLDHCTVVPEITVFLFTEITAFSFPVYNWGGSFRFSREQ